MLRTNTISGSVDAWHFSLDPFQRTYESVDGPTEFSLYDSYIFTTFPDMSSRAGFHHGSEAEEESGFLYSLEKSWQSIQEIGHDAIEGFKVRGDKAYDSVYDFTNHVTLGISDAIWSGAKDRTAKRKDSVGDYLDYWTLGFTGTVAGAVNPDDPFSKEHWANSFGLATSMTGVGKVVTPKPTSSVSGASKPKETGQLADVNAVTKDAGIGDKREGWSLSVGGGSINGRKYSQHALERMAPDIPEVRATLSNRAMKKAEELGYKPQTKEYSIFTKKYVDPRNIPPSVIEDAIKHTEKIPGNSKGTFIHETQDIKVIINEVGDIITVIPK